MKILLLGKKGQVGWELERTLNPLGEIIALGSEELDLTNERAIRSMVRKIKPELIVNAAAYTTVDKAEEEQDLAMAINGIAPGILAEEAKVLGSGIIHYSTDYVFAGTKSAPYVEKDEPKPINFYGLSKLAGEKAIMDTGASHLIFRVSWVYGLRRSNFMLKMIELAKERDSLSIVSDQVGAPTTARVIAEATSLVLSQGLGDMKAFLKEKSGIYHLSARGITNWYLFAEKILSSLGYSKKCELKPILTSEFESLAKRPLNSLMSNDKLRGAFNIKLPSWEQSLELTLKELKEKN